MTRITVSIALLAISISVIAQEPGEFRHDLPDGARPWAHENFDAADDKFTFAVFSDLTGGERSGVFEIAVAQLSLLRPELILNVGDLINGGMAARDELGSQWDSFDKRASRASAPVFYVGGNHDLADELLQSVWDERYGQRYYHFVYKDALFLVLNTEDILPERLQEIEVLRNEAFRVLRSPGMGGASLEELFTWPESSAGNVTAAQSEYFQQAIADNSNVRWTFLFMHKAAWEREGEKNFAAIESALSDRPYTVFHGHLHAYRYLERHGRDYIRLATTGGGQRSGFGRSMDQVTLVTVDDSGVDIANVLMAGILDKTGHIPLDGDDVCFEAAVCGGASPGR
jgi:UDP-2,3-diacylglucosamine pyrophosphatase LpxH